MVIDCVLLLIFGFLHHRISAQNDGKIEKGEGETIQLDPYTPGETVRAPYSLLHCSPKMPNILLPDPMSAFRSRSHPARLLSNISALTKAQS